MVFKSKVTAPKKLAFVLLLLRLQINIIFSRMMKLGIEHADRSLFWSVQRWDFVALKCLGKGWSCRVVTSTFWACSTRSCHWVAQSTGVIAWLFAMIGTVPLCRCSSTRTGQPQAGENASMLYGKGHRHSCKLEPSWLTHKLLLSKMLVRRELPLLLFYLILHTFHQASHIHHNRVSAQQASGRTPRLPSCATTQSFRVDLPVRWGPQEMTSK